MHELWLDRAFLYILVWRDLKVRYKQTVVRRGRALNVNVYVGPAYQEIIDHYTERSTVAA